MPELFTCFLFYSFLGFLLEVIFAKTTHNSKQDRKCFLFLPLCPVYGLGAVAILSLPNLIYKNPFLLFLAGGATASAVEYMTSLFYEFTSGVKFWDYADLPGNILGRVCLPFGLIWGVLSLGLVYYLHPHVRPLLSGLPPSLLWVCYLLVSADALLSLCLLRWAGSTAILKWYTPRPDANLK